MMPNTMKGAAICTASAKPSPDGLIASARRIAGRRDAGRRQEGVAVADRRDREMVQVGGEDQRHAEQGQEVADRGACCRPGRVDRHGEGEPELLGDEVAGRLQARHHQAAAEPDA